MVQSSLYLSIQLPKRKQIKNIQRWETLYWNMEFQLHEPFLKTFVSNIKCVKLKLKNILTEVFLVLICLHGIICLNFIV